MWKTLRYNFKSPSFYTWAFSFFPRIVAFLTGNGESRGAAADPKSFAPNRR